MQSEGQGEDLSSLRTDNNLDVTENVVGKNTYSSRKINKTP